MLPFGVVALIAMVFAVPLLVRAAADARVAVIYPDISEPFRGVFLEIIEGIEDKIGHSVVGYPVRADTDVDALKIDASVVIALGRQGMNAAAGLSERVGMVVGGVLTVPGGEARGRSVISLTPDPVLLFSRMKTLMPTVKRVFVVYDPQFNAWLIKPAIQAARAQGLELVTYEAGDLRGAVRLYKKIFSELDVRRDVLWLPQDPTTVEESSVLPLVLKESWDRNIGVFSSNVGHVRRGVLFSLYPDNAALGRRLAGLAQGMLVSGSDGGHGMKPLSDVRGAINMRTAKHLGFGEIPRSDFDMIFSDQ